MNPDGYEAGKIGDRMEFEVFFIELLVKIKQI
jgi:hypothetical protein